MSELAIFEQLGLTDKEAKVYLALLETGPSSVLTISKKAKIKRPTTYLVLEELKRKQLVRQSVKKTTTMFEAEDPTVFAARLSENLEKFKSALPKLTEKQRKTFKKNQSDVGALSKLYEKEAPAETIFFHGVSVSTSDNGHARKKVSGVLKVYSADD